VQPDELRSLLISIATDRLALIERHEAGARVVGHYDFNNAYQYIIAREETHLEWLRSALAEMGQPLPAAATAIPVPPLPKPGRTVEAPGILAVMWFQMMSEKPNRSARR
jgi:hypothetical protein